MSNRLFCLAEKQPAQRERENYRIDLAFKDFDNI